MHSLHSLSMPLLELILRFLPLRDKLMQLSRLSSAFPSLTPACFAEDSFRVRRSAIKALNRSSALLALLSRVRQLSVYAVRWPRRERARVAELEQSAQLSFSVAAFSRLQSLSIRLGDDSWYAGDEGALRLQHVLTPLSSLPQLRSLRIDMKANQQSYLRFIPLSDLALLSDLRALRSLALSLRLPVGSLSLLCSLPLEHLDLSQACLDSYELGFAQFQPPGVAASQPLPVSFSLRRLKLPLLTTSRAKEEAKRVLAAYGINRSGRAEEEAQPAELEIVHLFGDHEQLRELLWRIPSLTALTLIVSLGTRLSPQPAPASAGPMLPHLRSVALQICTPALYGYRSAATADRDVEARRRRDWLSEVAAECVGFLHAYSGQLLRLGLTFLPNLPAAAPIVQAALHCLQLRYLVLTGSKQREIPSFAAMSFAPLPQLHTLSLRSVGLSTAQLTALLHASSAVEHIELYAMPAFTLDLLPVIGRSCRRLKELEADACAEDLFSQRVEQHLAEQAAGSADTVFPQLVALQIGLSSYQPPALAPEGRPMLQWLLRLLRSAPVLRFLRLGLQLELSELLPFSSLTALRGLRLSGWEGWQQRFFHSTRQHRSPQDDFTVWQTLHEADRERELASHFRSERALFRDDIERFHGRTGREAFFAVVEARLAGRMEEEAGSDGRSDWSSDEGSRSDWELQTADDENAAERDDRKEGEEEKQAASEEEGTRDARKRRRVHES